MGEGEAPLEIWTVYWDPADAPRRFVVRRFELQDGKAIPRDAWHGATLEAVRLAIPAGRARVPPSTEDDPSVVELWL